MFTGIIEALGKVRSVESLGTNKTFWIQSPISNQLKVDQSVAHNGICLTVEEIAENMHRVTAIEETIKKTNISDWNDETLINLERCMQMNGRLDGHIVQGHVDTTGVCTGCNKLSGSWEYRFEIPEAFAHLIIEKGSISLNGTSLTIFNVSNTDFTVAIIPYTYEHTNIQQVQQSSVVNIEFDLIGKYVNRFHQLKNVV